MQTHDKLQQHTRALAALKSSCAPFPSACAAREVGHRARELSRSVLLARRYQCTAAATDFKARAPGACGAAPAAGGTRS